MPKFALVLIGFQNDYFSDEGILHSYISESSAVTGALSNTIKLIENHHDSFDVIVSTPICFTENYDELTNPIGILSAIKEVGAFKQGTYGAKEISEFDPFKDVITTIPGKRGLNAFTDTELESFLLENDISDVVLAGTVTSICIDSTGRSAHERGFNVTILNDCTSSRTPFEQQFYCEHVFPLYSRVIGSKELVNLL